MIETYRNLLIKNSDIKKCEEILSRIYVLEVLTVLLESDIKTVSDYESFVVALNRVASHISLTINERNKDGRAYKLKLYESVSYFNRYSFDLSKDKISIAVKSHVSKIMAEYIRYRENIVPINS